MKPLTLKWIADAVEGIVEQSPSDINTLVEWGEVVIDSRKIENKGIYIPIQGERFDGHQFIPDLLDKGIYLIITMLPLVNIPEDIAVIQVKDTKIAIGKFAQAYRRLFNIPVLAITGSVGKTTTKEMLSHILGQKFNVHWTKGNLNNDLGVPLTLLAMKEDVEFALIEAGMDKLGELSYLSQIIAPTAVIFTNIGTAHIGNLGSQDKIFEAKSEILEHLADNGPIFIDGDDAYLVKYRKNYKHVFAYGYHSNCQSRVTSMTLNTTGATEVEIEYDQIKYCITINALGSHLPKIGAMGLLVGKYFDVSQEAISIGVTKFKNEKMRMEYKAYKGYHFINDAYNASYDSIVAASKTVFNFPVEGQRKIVLGDVFECGEMRTEIHQNIGKIAAIYPLDVYYFTGEAMRFAYEEVIQLGMKSFYFESRSDCAKCISDSLDQGDLVLFKGSRGMRMEEILEEVMNNLEVM